MRYKGIFSILFLAYLVTVVGCSNDGSNENDAPVSPTITMAVTEAPVSPTITTAVTEAPVTEIVPTAVPKPTEKPLVNIHLNDYYTVYFEGYDQGGRAYVEFDKEQFLLDHIDNVTYNEKNYKVYKELYGSDLPINGFKRCFSVYVKAKDGSEYLENGEIAQLVWDIDTEKINNYFVCNYTFDNTEIEVSGLKELTSFDPFEHIVVDASGFEPNGKARASFSPKEPGEYTGLPVDVDYEVTPAENLSNGDEVTVKFICEDLEELIAKSGKYPERFEKTYTISGLNGYIDDISDIPKETLDKIDKYFSDYYGESSDRNIIEEKKRIGFISVIPSKDARGDGNTHLYMIYRLKGTSINWDGSEKTDYTRYVVLTYDDVIIKDGKVKVYIETYPREYYSKKELDNMLKLLIEDNSYVDVAFSNYEY